MKIKLLLIGCLLLSGNARAETSIQDELDAIRAKLSDIKIQLLRMNRCEIRTGESSQEIVKEGLCPSGWKKSNYYLEGVPEYKKSGVTAWKCEPIYVCPDNGLLRVKP